MEILRKRVRDLEMKYESGNSNTWSIPQREFLQARRSRRAEVPGNRESDEASVAKVVSRIGRHHPLLPHRNLNNPMT
uniref:Uncharacterized protein n=1 Tax=Meloidogyne incognita TaxID=6306 RepID=A0A914KK78_MELIC